MTLDQISEVHKVLGAGTASEIISAANTVLLFCESPDRIDNEDEGMRLLKRLLQTFLDNDQYLEAGALIWPCHLFDTRPQFTRDIFKAIIEDNQLLIPGANGTSKSYATTAFMYLDWRRDPEYTMIKMAAVNEEHLKRTLMAQVKQFHLASAIPMDQKITDNEMYFGVDGLPDMGIAGVLLPQGTEGTGRIRGYKPKPLRKIKHPRFGYSSRVRFFGDEGQIYRSSVFKDFGSMQSAMNGPDPVKIVITYNPDSTDRPVVVNAMPSQGYLIEDLEVLYRYRSKKGWSVLRLDASKCENVIQRKEIYPGLQSFEGYMKFVHGGGDTSADYFEKARGFPPIKGAFNIVIPTTAPQEYRGEAIFIEPPEVYASVDCAYQGEDGAVLTLARYGVASGWIKENGEKVVFVDYLNPTERKPRHILQYDQQIQLINRDDTVSLGEEIIEKCKSLKIKPENVGIDGPQPVDEPVITPTGWRPIGELKVGDWVIGSSGMPVCVTGVYPQGIKTIMRITMNDGAWTRCTPDHLWKVKDSVIGEKIMTTLQIEERLRKEHQRGMSVPLVSAPVEFSPLPDILPVDPYLLGCLLGDGNFGKYRVRFSTVEKEMLDRVTALLPHGMKVKYEGHNCYNFYMPRWRRSARDGRFVTGNNPLLNAIRSLRLDGVLGENKFIPESYMRASPADRLAVLQGIMDTDGFLNLSTGAPTSACAGIRSTSERLMRDTAEIVESLGGWAILKKEKIPTKFKSRSLSQTWLVTLGLPMGMSRFRLSRKRNGEHTRYTPKRRLIKKLEVEGRGECVCIKVDAPDSLYVTRHCIVTHNTGNGFGTYSHLKNYWKKPDGTKGDVVFVQWARKATEKKILNEDQATASAVYDTIISEMWFTVRRWMESGCIIISPMIAHTPLNQQLTNRRFARVRGGLMHVESKPEYKSRGNTSPDEADSFIMVPYVIRHTHPILPGMQVDSETEKEDEEDDQHHEIDESRHIDPDMVETSRHLVVNETEA